MKPRGSVRGGATRLEALAFALALASCDGGHDGPGAQSTPVEEPASIESAANGAVAVALTPEARAAAGIETVAAGAVELAEERSAFGALAADPARVALVRAPFAGTVVADEARAWPSLGERVESGATLGRIAPRAAPLTPSERADVASKLASARSDLASARAELGTASAALERAKTLNAEGKGVSDQALEDAQARVAETQARLDAARSSVGVFEELSKAPGASTLEPAPILAPLAGEVVELFAQPGANVEAGSELLRIADFAELFADVRLPVGSDLASGDVTPTRARVTPTGSGARGTSFEASVVGPAPSAELLAPTWRLRVRAGDARLRPGLGVTASIETGAPARRLAQVPASAVLRHAGRDWVYVEEAPNRYARRAVEIARSGAELVAIGSGVAIGERVVAVGAELLLSHEVLAAGGGEGE